MTTKRAFTFAEVLSVLVILGVVASVTIPVTITRVRQRQNVTTLLATYSSLSEAVETYMIENGCIGNFAGCAANVKKQYGVLSKPDKSFAGIAQKLNVVDKTCNGTQKNWLSRTPVTMYDGSKQQYDWEGPAQLGNDPVNNCYYLLKNNAVLHFQFLDSYGQSGFGSIDVNGKKGPNRFGVDIFPISFGASNNPKYAANGLNPYWGEDNNGTMTRKNKDGEIEKYHALNQGAGANEYKGMCRISCSGCECQADEHSPTSYVLKNKKLPPSNN